MARDKQQPPGFGFSAAELPAYGTDGARLCFMGLPTPNLFTGGHNFHSKQEWIALEDMKKASEVIVHLMKLWAK